MLPEVTATRYVTPLREGGSLPGLVEADDLGTYVMKFTGAGQGRKTLVAEVVCGRARPAARPAGARTGARCELDPVIGLGEPDQEVQELLKASGGLNLGMDFLPGSLGFDPLAYEVSPQEAGRVVWFDALVNNVDRSWRNPNLLVWHGELWLIDHGATHDLAPQLAGAAQAAAAKPYDASDHALAPFAPGHRRGRRRARAAGHRGAARRGRRRRPRRVAGRRARASTRPDARARAPTPRRCCRAPRTIHERITLGEPGEDRPSQAPGWLTAHGSHGRARAVTGHAAAATSSSTRCCASCPGSSAAS